jgi:signal transduction histidine kinase
MVQRKRSIGLLVFSVATASLLAAMLGLSIFTSERLAWSSARVDQTMLVKVAVGELLRTLFEAEAGQRRYILTGRTDYLEPYNRARSLARAQVERLRLLTSDSEAQHVRVAEIGRLTSAMLDELQRAVEQRDHEGLDAAIALLDTDAGLHTMNALWGNLDAMGGVEDLLLARRRERQQRYESLVLGSLVVAIIFLGLSMGVVVFSGRAAELRLRATEYEEGRLRAENEVLSERHRTAELQERFAGVLGHDLRNPLSSITMGVEVLRRYVPMPQQRALDRMASSAARMSRMIDQLLDLTRSRLGGGIAVRPAPMNLGTLVTDVAEEACVAHPGHRLALEATGDLDGAWDSDRLAQVVSNLVGNAMVHGAPDGGVTVVLRGAVDTVEVDVSSLGNPIPDALKETLFDPFRRGARAGDLSRTSGLGLGLYISREIVVAHGGTITVVSCNGDGTTFHVVLPRAPTASGERDMDS